MTSQFRAARAAIAAGLGFAMALGPALPALADTQATAKAGASDTPVVGEYAAPDYTAQVRGSSTGDTQLYIVGTQNDITTAEGAQDENIKVSIPVAIHYVADTEGNLVGPDDDVVKFVNHTRVGSVHVSKIAVSSSKNVTIVKSSEVGGKNDTMAFSLTPVQGQSNKTGATFTRGTANEGNDTDYVKVGTTDELGYYTAAGATTAKTAVDPQNRGDWNIAQKNGALALNGLTGKIGGFKSIDPSTDYQAGTIHWVVRGGTRAQADASDSTLKIHYNANTGSNKGCVPVAEQKVVVLNAAQLPAKVAVEAGLSQATVAGTSVTPPADVTKADGTRVAYAFKEWNTKADGKGAKVEKVSDLVGKVSGVTSAEDLGGKTVELYAIFTEVQ